MNKVFRHWWRAGVVGLFAGIPIGVALEYARRAYNDAAIAAVARDFESKGMSAPLFVDFLQPLVVPTVTSIIVALTAVLIYAIIVRRTSCLNATR